MDLELGDHLLKKRPGYLHHGIYVGGGQVIHYAGLANGFEAGPIEAISIDEFATRRCLRVRSHGPNAYSRDEIAERALSRLDEDEYNLLTNNCEHFANWCIYGDSRSDQVSRALNTAAVLHAAHTLPVVYPLVAKKAGEVVGKRAAAASLARTAAAGACGGSGGVLAGSATTAAGVAALSASAPVWVPVAVGVAVGVGAVALWDAIWD